ncbi:MAG: hypothetical protein U1D99_01650, partial [Candidatus Omnitrophota bacterium]|nr:hypothetical protein [Candidatus Omnitrophota bacterium]
PRKRFYYKPALSHSQKTLACQTTGQRGETQVILIGIEKKDGQVISTGERELAGPFRNVSRFAWSPDDKQLAFSYMDEESVRKGVSPVAVYDVDTGKRLFRISDYVSSPQWLDDRYLMTGYWVATPFQGQNIHTFSGFLVFDVSGGLVTDLTIKSQNENLLVLRDSGTIVAVDNKGLVFKSMDSAFSPVSEYETNVAAVVERSRENAGITEHARPTSLDVGSWKTYRNDNFGVSFKYPSDWKFLVAAGDGYMNIMIGKGTDGIEINLTSLPESPAEPADFEKAFLEATAQGHWPYAVKDMASVTIGGHEFFRARSEGIEESTLNLTYYLNAPVVGKAFPQLTDVMVFSLKSFIEGPEGTDPNGEVNPSHQVLKTLLSTVKTDVRK